MFETTHEVPDDLVSFVRLLLMPAPEWEKTKAKSKLPKAKTDETVLAIVADTLVRRLSDYPTTLEVRLIDETSQDCSYILMYTPRMTQSYSLHRCH